MSLDSTSQYKNASYLLLSILVQNFTEDEFNLAGYHPNPERKYQIFLDYDLDESITYLLIAANSNEQYEKLKIELKLLSSTSKILFKFDNVANFVRIELSIDQIKAMYKTLFYEVPVEYKQPEEKYQELLTFLVDMEMVLEHSNEEIKNEFCRQLSKQKVSHISTLDKITEITNNKIYFLLVPEAAEQNVECLLTAADRLVKFYLFVDIKVANALIASQSFNTKIAKISPDLADLKSGTLASNPIREILAETPIETVTNESAASTKKLTESILIECVAAKLSGIGEYKLNYDLSDSLTESDCTQQLQDNIERANKFMFRVAKMQSDQLADLYRRKYENVPASNTQITLNICTTINQEFGCQQDINTPYIQCGLQHVFKDFFNYENDGKKHLTTLLEEFDIPSYMRPELILQKMGFYMPDIYEHYHNDINHIAGKINMAWEYSLVVGPLDLVTQFYKTKSLDPMKLAIAQVSVPLPNLALFFLLDAMDSETDRKKQDKRIVAAVRIVKLFDLIIPKKSESYLFNPALGLFTPEEKQHFQGKYNQEQARQFQLLQRYHQFCCALVRVNKRVDAGALVANSFLGKVSAIPAKLEKNGMSRNESFNPAV